MYGGGGAHIFALYYDKVKKFQKKFQKGVDKRRRSCYTIIVPRGNRKEGKKAMTKKEINRIKAAIADRKERIANLDKWWPNLLENGRKMATQTAVRLAEEVAELEKMLNE